MSDSQSSSSSFCPTYASSQVSIPPINRSMFSFSSSKLQTVSLRKSEKFAFSPSKSKASTPSPSLLSSSKSPTCSPLPSLVESYKNINLNK